MADLTDTKNHCPSLERLREGPPTVSIETAAEYLGISRPFAYRLAKSGGLPVIRLTNTRMRVPTARLLRMLEGEGHTAMGDRGVAR